MRFHLNFLACATLLSCPSLSTATEEPPVEQIMEKVAANQDRAQEMRREFVYRQKVIIRFTRGNGRLAREERRELQVTPTPEQTEKILLRFVGSMKKTGSYWNIRSLDFDIRNSIWMAKSSASLQRNSPTTRSHVTVSLETSSL
jgi:hypothetical protein